MYSVLQSYYDNEDNDENIEDRDKDYRQVVCQYIIPAGTIFGLIAEGMDMITSEWSRGLSLWLNKKSDVS